jgi:uncharacterized protein
MTKASRAFQVFVKPTGSTCNLGCVYCYYLNKEHLYSENKSKMSEEILEKYIIQHIDATLEDVISFSWHGGEPTILGLDYFYKIVELQRKHYPPNKKIFNGIQTNGTLLDDAWCRFLAKEGFMVGISLDGPKKMHNRFRTTKDNKPTYMQTMRGYNLLQKHGVRTEILCVVNSYNAQFPHKVYKFFKNNNAQYITFLPLVEHQPHRPSLVSERTIPSETWGKFLCSIFDEWVERDIGQVKIQVFEEATRTAFNQEHSLCIFRPTCGDIPVIEHNGDFYSCDHYVDAENKIGNIKDQTFVELLESQKQKEFGEIKLQSLPRYCKECEVRDMCNGECPKNRFMYTPDGELGLNYLCEGYKHFFNYCQPFVTQVATLWKQQS